MAICKCAELSLLIVAVPDLSVNVSVVLRRPNGQPWTQRHEECLQLLQSSPQALASDNLLCQIIRVSRICELITIELHFSDLETAYDVTASQVTMQRLHNDITSWVARIPVDLRTPTLLFWQHLVMLYLHEPVLHTSTNKQSFAAPFLAERISLTDFAAPTLTPEHVVSFYALRDAAHALLDTFTSLSATELLELGSIVYTSRAIYAMYILAKMYIAVTATGSTFSMVADMDGLKIDEYLHKLMLISAQVNKIDERAVRPLDTVTPLLVPCVTMSEPLGSDMEI